MRVTTSRTTDTYISETYPAATWWTDSKLMITSGITGSKAQSYLHWDVAVPGPGAVVQSCTLVMRVAGAHAAASRTLRVRRTAPVVPVPYTKLAWENRPPVVDSTAATVALTTALADLQQITVDITAMMQQVASGAPWSGVMLQVDQSAILKLHGAAALPEYRPVIVTVWSDAPTAPTNLQPSDGRLVGTRWPTLRFDVDDYGGSTTIQSVELALHAADSPTSQVLWSGTQATDAAEFRLDASAYAGLPTNSALVWWRVRVQDGAGIWGPWSELEAMGYRAQDVSAITTPSGGVITDLSPAVSWTAPNQRAYQLQVVDVSRPGRVVWDTGKVTAGTTSRVVPLGYLADDRSYDLALTIWPTQNYQSVPGFPAARTVTRRVTANDDATVTAPTSLTAVAQGPFPTVKVEWGDTSGASQFDVYRDGVMLARVEALAALVSPGLYRYTDETAPPSVSHSWQVRAVANGRRSVPSPAATARPVCEGIWLSIPGTSTRVWITDADEPDIDMHEISAVRRPHGGGAPVVITQALGGYEGTFAGVVTPNPDGMTVNSPAAAETLLTEFRDRPGRSVILTTPGLRLTVLLRRLVVAPLSLVDDGEDPEYAVSAEFYQSAGLRQIDL